MSKITERIYNIETGELQDLEREMTKQEIELAKIAEKRAADELAKFNELQNAKSALLAKIGITEDEAKLLLS